MKKGYILTIDQGTTYSKAFLIDYNGFVKSSASCELSVKYHGAGWVEQDPLDIWNSVKVVIDECIVKLGNPDIEAIAITNQRESTILWDRKTGMPVGPCITWQCRRTLEFCRDLKEKKLDFLIKEKTGLVIDPIFSASKANWLIKNTENGYNRAECGELCLGTVDSWVLFNLTGKKTHACDISNASRTQLFNINDLIWDKELLEIFGVPEAALPKVMKSSDIFGRSISIGSLKSGIVIASMIGDSHAALFGHGCLRPGTIKVTYGTGSSLMTPIEKPILSNSGLTTTIAWMLKEKVIYALEGVIPVTGTAIKWLRRILDIENVKQIDMLAESIKDTQGIYFVPAFVGLGAPHWNASARGMITGLLSSTSRAHLARATLESIVYQVRDIYDVMKKESRYDLVSLFADGGPSNSDFIMQFQADINSCSIFRSREQDVSALGAAYLAGLSIGFWSSEKDIAKLPRKSDCFKPCMSIEDRDRLYNGWLKAIKKINVDC
jgi:glycerol kinase